MGISDDNGDTRLGEGVDVRIFGCQVPVGSCGVENDILGGFFLRNILLEVEETFLRVYLVSVEFNDVLLEVRVQTAFLDEDVEVLVPLVVLLRVAFC